MIAKTTRYLFSIQTPYEDPFQHQRAKAILATVWAFVMIWAIWLFGLTLPANGLSVLSLLASAAILLLASAAFLVLKAGRVALAGAILISALTFISLAVMYFLPQTNPRFILVVMLPLVAAGMLFNRQGIIGMGLLLGLGVLFLQLLNIRQGAASVGNPFADVAQILLIIGLATAILALFANQRQEVTRAALRDLGRLRNIFQTVSRVSPQTTQTQVLQQAIRFLRDSFQYDFVQIYLLDDDGRLSRRLRSGVQDIERISHENALATGDTHIFSDALRLQQPIQVSAQQSPARAAHLLPAIQQGIVIPIVHCDRSLGVMDIQSVRPDRIQPKDVDVLTILAAEIGTLLYLLNHIERLTADLTDRDAMTNRLQSQLSTLQAQRQQLISHTWSDYISKRGQQAIGFDLEGSGLRYADEIPEAMQRAMERGEVYVSFENDEKLINVPIQVRGETLGAMNFSIPVDQAVTEKQMELARTIAVRLGGALESTRLLEQTRAQADRERKASAVADLLIGATNVDTLLSVAVSNFNDTLGAIQTQIFVEPRRIPTDGNVLPGPGYRNGHESNSNGDGT
jgi:GAF domain-containing protein